MAGRYDRKDHVYKKAKSQGLRSRAAFKLEELDRSFHLLRSGTKVLDLGAWPGGWLQVAAKRVGPRGKIVGIDLSPIEGFEEKHIKLLTGNVGDEEVLQAAREFAGGGFDVVLSDMAAKLTGIKSVDRVAASGCAELALWVAGSTLRSGGNFVVKMFKSEEANIFQRDCQKQFEKVIRKELKTTRKTSQEYYLVCFGFRGA